MKADIPTWLPEFSIANMQKSTQSWNSFDASRGLPAAVSIFSRRRKLKMLAIPIAKIVNRSVSLSPNTSYDGILTAFLQWRSVVIAEYGFWEPAHQAFCSLMLAGSVFTPADFIARGWMREVYGTVSYLQEL
jgi:hypothetical protein